MGLVAFIAHIKREWMTLPLEEFSWITYNWCILKSPFKFPDDTGSIGGLVNLNNWKSQIMFPKMEWKKIGVGKAGVSLLPHKK